MNATLEGKSISDEVYTRLGKGRAVYTLPDGRVLVEFDHGGGELFSAEEVFRPRGTTRTTRRATPDQH